MFVFLVDLDTNGKMTSFLFYPYLRRDGNGVSEFFFLQNSSRNSLWWWWWFLKEFLMMKKTSRFNFCSMGKTKKLVILPLVSKSAGKKTYTICILWLYSKIFFLMILLFNHVISKIFKIYIFRLIFGKIIWIELLVVTSEDLYF